MFFQTVLFVMFNKVITAQVRASLIKSNPFVSLLFVREAYPTRVRVIQSLISVIVLHLVPAFTALHYPTPQYLTNTRNHARWDLDRRTGDMAVNGLQARVHG